MTETLHQQAEALANDVWHIVDGYDESVKAELAKPNAIGIPGSIIGEASDKLKAQLLAALRTREAETWEQAAQEVEEAIGICIGHANAEQDPVSWLTGLLTLLRARAAQPQVDHAD